MKKIGRFKVLLLYLIVAYLLSACSGATTPSSVNDNEGVPSPVAFTGVVENIVGDQWTINGVTVTVDPAVVQEGPFSAGDQIRVEGVVSQDGVLTISRVEPASPEDLATLPEFGTGTIDNSNDANSNDANTNDSNANDDNSNDDNSNDTNTNDNNNDSNSNDDNGNDTNSNDNSNSNDDNSNDDDNNDSNSNDDDDSGSNSNDDDNENDD